MFCCRLPLAFDEPTELFTRGQPLKIQIQCDQMIKYKVAQLFPKVIQKERQQFFFQK